MNEVDSLIFHCVCFVCDTNMHFFNKYGLITPGTDLVLRDFHKVRAHLATLTSNEVNLRVLAVYAFPCIFLRIFSS